MRGWYQRAAPAGTMFRSARSSFLLDEPVIAICRPSCRNNLADDPIVHAQRHLHAQRFHLAGVDGDRTELFRRFGDVRTPLASLHRLSEMREIVDFLRNLQRATEQARAMVAELGMSDTVNPVAFHTRSRAPFLPVPGFEQPEAIAEETAREIDIEVKRLMTDAHDRAIHVLREHRPTLDGLVCLLLEREVVDGDEVRRLLTGETTPPALRVASA